MEDGEIASEIMSVGESRKDADVGVKDEKGVEDESLPEVSDKEDGELDDEHDPAEKNFVENMGMQENGESTECGDAKEVIDEDGEINQQDSDGEITEAKEFTGSNEKQSTLDADIGNISIRDDQQHDTANLVKNTTEGEDGELDDSVEEVHKADDQENNVSNLDTNVTEGEDGEVHDSVDEDHKVKLENQEQKSDNTTENINKETRMDFDESRPEDEQLDYGEDELEEKIKTPTLKQSVSEKIKSDGEADSDSEGEIKSDVGEDFEEGETRDHPLDLPPGQKKVCRFFEMGNCTWGDRCRYLHPGINDKGNYDMFSDEPPKRPEPLPRRDFHPPPHLHPDPFWEEPPPFRPPPAAETAWEKGLRHAKEMKKRALQRKVQEPDFLQKREVISTIGALNEDRDMEFVNIAPLTNKGYDPFKEEESGEYATPTAEEVRRHLNRDNRRPPSHRHHIEKDRHRLPPPDHMMHSDAHRGRRPPSPRRDRYPPDARGLSPRRDIERERPMNYPPNELGFPPHFNDRRDHHELAGPGNIHAIRRADNLRSEPGLERMKDTRPDDKALQNGGPSSGQGQSWSDPWARGRPQAKGRNKAKSESSSSSDSSSGSSSRSSSSGSSRSSYSSKSSSSGSDSSSDSSDRDSSRSPSPNRGSKKKVLATVKQRNAGPGVVKKVDPLPKAPPSLKPVAPLQTAPVPSKSAIPINRKPPLNKMPLPQNPSVLPVPSAKAAVKKKTRKPSSSSSEFSHSSDSSPSPSRAKGKSDSDSDSGSSSGSSSSSDSSSSTSSSSDSEGDKPANRRKRKPLKPPTSQVPHPATQRALPTLQNQPPHNKGKVMVPSKPGRKDIKMTIIDKPGMPKKRTAAEMSGGKKPSSRRTELLEQLKAVEDAIARKRAKLN